MRQIIWTNFAISELKNIFLYYRMVAGDKVADKIRKSIFNSTKPLIKHPFIGPIEENLIDLKQEHLYLVERNYKSFIKLRKTIFTSPIFLIVDKTLIK